MRCGRGCRADSALTVWKASISTEIGALGAARFARLCDALVARRDREDPDDERALPPPGLDADSEEVVVWAARALATTRPGDARRLGEVVGALRVTYAHAGWAGSWPRTATAPPTRPRRCCRGTSCSPPSLAIAPTPWSRSRRPARDDPRPDRYSGPCRDRLARARRRRRAHCARGARGGDRGEHDRACVAAPSTGPARSRSCERARVARAHAGPRRGRRRRAQKRAAATSATGSASAADAGRGRCRRHVARRRSAGGSRRSRDCADRARGSRRSTTFGTRSRVSCPRSSSPPGLLAIVATAAELLVAVEMAPSPSKARRRDRRSWRRSRRSRQRLTSAPCCAPTGIGDAVDPHGAMRGLFGDPRGLRPPRGSGGAARGQRAMTGGPR